MCFDSPGDLFFVFGFTMRRGGEGKRGKKKKRKNNFRRVLGVDYNLLQMIKMIKL